MRLEGRSRRRGSKIPVELDIYNNLLTSQGGKYRELALSGRLFHASNQAKVATSTTLNNTFTGLAIANPLDSGKVYIMHEFAYAMMDSSSADTNLSLVATPIHTGYAGGTNITIRCARHGFKTSSALANEAATITGASGVIVKHIGTLGTNVTTDLLTTPTIVDLHGQIILDPGRVIATDTLLASGTVMLFSFMWEEQDV